MSTKGKVRPARRANNPVVLIVPNVKVRMEALHYMSQMGLQDLLRGSFSWTNNSAVCM
jgi:hypothetical protein